MIGMVSLKMSSRFMSNCGRGRFLRAAADGGVFHCWTCRTGILDRGLLLGAAFLGSAGLGVPTREPKSVLERHICTVEMPIRSRESRQASAWEYLSIISARTVVPARRV